ncbi:response regulator [Reichenbachiella faecimaris]|uniref:response regulator n=1 Tax=Reichenbachiella faecimaris TaxID=692418 RepID=UPI00111C69D6|nr:response regulator [Reichenbachiella faecimaris]
MLSHNVVAQETNNTSYEKFTKTFDSLVNYKEFDMAYNLLSDESESIILGGEKFSTLYYELLYNRVKSEYLSGNYLESISLAREFIFRYPKKDSLLGYTYSYLGNAYYQFDDYDIALDCYFKAKKIYDSEKRYSEVSKVLSSVGLIYNNLEDYDEALKYYVQANELLKKNNVQAESHNYTQIARLYTRNENYAMAQLYLDSALKLALTQNKLKDQYYAQRSLGYNFFIQEKYSEAYFNYQKAYDGYLSINSIDHSLDCSLKLAYIHYNLKEYSEVYRLCESQIPIAYNIGDLNAAVFFSRLMYKALIKDEKYKEAIFVQENFKQIEDSIERIQNNSYKYKIQMRLETEKRANENELLKQQKIADQETIRAQNILLYSVGLGLFLVVVIALIIYRTYLINKRLSFKIQQQSDRLKQLDEAKSRFFANISHDLRTPLTLIMGGIEQVLKSEDLLLTEKAERQLKTGLLNGERIIHLTNEINELIKLEDGKLAINKKYVDIDKMLNLFVKMFNSMAELKGVHLSYSKSIFEGDSYVHIDPSQFEKVLFNLITNALKHTKKDDSVTVALNKDGDQLLISVIDSGEGIPEQNLPYIFERYYQAPDTTFKTQEGFGIGLALVKEIINKHDANIQVKSKLGQGSEFIITIQQESVPSENLTQLYALTYSDQTRVLFRELDEPLGNDNPIVNVNKRSSDKATLLIVEDHPEVREFIQNIVEKKYNVLTAPNGQKALKVLDKEEVDLIITDLMMPWFDGFELLEKLKESDKLRKIPALVLSARTSEEDKTKVLSQGVNDFLCKPFNPEELLKRIENLLNRKEIWNNNNEGALFINNQQTLDEIEQSLLKKVEHLILEKIDDPNLSVNYLADQIAVSERKFYRMIKKMTDSTPFEFIKEVRMQYALQILKEKNVSSASEVAKAIGMNNVSHFNTQFKKRFGKTPIEFK